MAKPQKNPYAGRVKLIPLIDDSLLSLGASHDLLSLSQISADAHNVAPADSNDLDSMAKGFLTHAERRVSANAPCFYPQSPTSLTVSTDRDPDAALSALCFPGGRCRAEQLAQLLASAAAADPRADVQCPAGAVMSLYNVDITLHYNVPSHKLKVTRGLVKYASFHERFGSQTRFRFQVCRNYLENTCALRGQCNYIHVPADQLPVGAHVHVNPYGPRDGDLATRGKDEAGMVVAEAYSTLPRGFVVPVYRPEDSGSGDASAAEAFPSHLIIVTAGATSSCRNLDNPTPPQHHSLQQLHHDQHSRERALLCWHFLHKRVCYLGAACRFIHAKAGAVHD